MSAVSFRLEYDAINTKLSDFEKNDGLTKCYYFRWRREALACRSDFDNLVERVNTAKDTSLTDELAEMKERFENLEPWVGISLRWERWGGVAICSAMYACIFGFMYYVARVK